MAKVFGKFNALPFTLYGSDGPVGAPDGELMALTFNKRVGEKLLESKDISPVDGENDVSLAESVLVVLASLPDQTDGGQRARGHEGNIHLRVAHHA